MLAFLLTCVRPNFFSTFFWVQVVAMPFTRYLIIFWRVRESHGDSRDCLPSAWPPLLFGMPSCFPINGGDFMLIKVGGWYDHPQWHPYGNSIFPPFCPQSEVSSVASTGYLQTEAQTLGGCCHVSIVSTPPLELFQRAPNCQGCQQQCTMEMQVVMVCSLAWQLRPYH